MAENVTNVVVAGLGGQGVLKASDILAESAFRAGLDVKKAEVHGMSQRGGSVTSDVRFGAAPLSPMVPDGEAENNRRHLRDGGVLIAPDCIDADRLPHKRSLNVAMLGVLSTYLDIPEADWLAAVRANLPAKVHEVNEQAFAMGRAAGRQ
jgi:indolepyruvate ferredoxin oxidoreductase beta subunit